MNARQTTGTWVEAVVRLFGFTRRTGRHAAPGAAPKPSPAPLGVFGCLSGVTIDPNRR